MIKNALEASKKGETISIDVIKKRNNFIIEVQNKAHNTTKDLAKIFKRSYSSKGTGRGIGTYSMKISGERYLKGKIHFTSSREKAPFFSSKFHNYYCHNPRSYQSIYWSFDYFFSSGKTLIFAN